MQEFQVAPVLADGIQLRDKHPDPGAVHRRDPLEVEQNPGVALGEQAVDVFAQNQVAGIKCEGARQRKDDHVVDPAFGDFQFGWRVEHARDCSAGGRGITSSVMVLTQSELIASLQNEVRILQHLITKIEPSMLDYRPTPKQRSTIELLKYLTLMGPSLIRAAKTGTFDVPAWTAAEQAAASRDFDQTAAALAAQAGEYATLLGDMTEDDFRGEIEMFGTRYTRGAFIVNLVLCACAAYRTQLFNYLKACGREELGTTNLWGGMDASAGG